MDVRKVKGDNWEFERVRKETLTRKRRTSVDVVRKIKRVGRE